MRKSAFIYFLSELALKAIPFLMLPFITSHLSKSEYGTLNVLLSINELMVVLIAFSMPIYLKLKFQILPKDKLFFQCISITLCMFLVVFSFYICVFISRAVDGLLSYLPIFSLFQVLYLVVVAYCQSEEDFIRLVKINAIVSLLSVGITILLLLAGFKVEGRLVGIFFPYVISFVVFLIIEKLRVLKEFKCVSNKELVRFGGSLLPSNLGWWFKGGFDKVFLAQSLSLSEVGLYALAFQISSVLPVLINVANQVLLQRFYRLYRTERSKAKYLTVYCIGAFSIVALVFAIVLPYVSYFFADSFSSSMSLIPWFVMSFWAQSLVVFISNWLVVRELNSFLSLSSIISIAIYIALMNSLFPHFGILSPIIASFLSNIILAVVMLFRLSRGKH